MKFSIIVLLYNSKLEKIFLTLDSILKQSLKDFEIIIADDGSKESYYSDIKVYMEKNHFSNCQYTLPKKNVGTVRNILDGLSLCKGKYIKLIGAGDLLFNEYILEKIFQYMEENHAKFCFGLMKAYKIKENKICQFPFCAPKDIQVYRNCKSPRCMKIIRYNLIVYHDTISGASLFYEAEKLKNYLEQMKTTVKYSEDLITLKAVLDNEQIYFFDHIVISYEVGNGISTRKENTKATNKIYLDFLHFQEYLIKHYDEKILVKGQKLLDLRHTDFSLINGLKKILYDPRRLFFLGSIFIQKYLNLHSKKEQGFIDMMQIEDLQCR